MFTFNFVNLATANVRLIPATRSANKYNSKLEKRGEALVHVYRTTRNTRIRNKARKAIVGLMNASEQAIRDLAVAVETGVTKEALLNLNTKSMNSLKQYIGRRDSVLTQYEHVIYNREQVDQHLAREAKNIPTALEEMKQLRNMMGL